MFAIPSSVPSTFVVAGPGHPHGAATTTSTPTAATGHSVPENSVAPMMGVVVAVTVTIIVGLALGFSLWVRRAICSLRRDGPRRSSAIFAPPFTGVTVDPASRSRRSRRSRARGTTTTTGGVNLRTFAGDAAAAAMDAHAREESRRLRDEGLNELGEAPPTYKPVEDDADGNANVDPPAYTPTAADAAAALGPTPPPPVHARHDPGTPAELPPRYPSPIPLDDLRPRPGGYSNPPT
ncbi:uncharacterized protein C8A04DRAFT_32616 [Dichotomopilus funicola]|uniref:Transmembrane protein n=1 Tax=Dichotomopilus funicola TaxID=1934379 RepID=A0AAN6UWK3_9PEZI|nr:hypothetical protein C8A04DRAFT_32616 [Dichotomopilus funicola]